MESWNKCFSLFQEGGRGRVVVHLSSDQRRKGGVGDMEEA